MKKILVADDDENILSSLTDILEIQGYKVVAVSNGEEVLSRIHAELPDLLILDIMMPEMDGASVAVDLNMRSSTRNIPIIFISGMIQKDLNAEVTNRANTMYLSKPFEVNKLLEMVEKALAPKQ